MLEFASVPDRKFPVEIRRRKGMRHMRLSINLQNSIVVSAPWHRSKAECLDFIDNNRRWLEQQIARVPPVIHIREWLRLYPELSAGGQWLAVSIGKSTTSRARYCIDRAGARIELQLPPGLDPDAAVSGLVRKFAGEVLPARVGEFSARHGLRLSRISVRDQSSRWGSCSSRRAISLNWRLVLLRSELQDYVILHELAHLTEMNHSKRFWALLDAYDPHRREHESELNARAPGILRVCLCD